MTINQMTDLIMLHELFHYIDQHEGNHPGGQQGLNTTIWNNCFK
jgi:hypothetical protein